MKTIRRLTLYFSIFILVSLNFYNIFAASFNDVNEEHYAFYPIHNVADLSLLVGDLSGNFNPESHISKFDSAKVFAKVNAKVKGYNNVYKENEYNAYFKKIYDKYSSLIEKYEKKYSRWNSRVSHEIAYLLENNILKLSDLDNFIVLGEDLKENLRALSREEAALFLVRIMGKEEEVNQMTFTYTFKDNDQIAKDKLNSVYYLKSIGVISDSQYLNPKNAITKAELAIMLDKFLKFTKIKIDNENLDLINLSNDSNLYTQLANILNIDIENMDIQLKIDFQIKSYKLKEDVSIYIDNKPASLSEIEKGDYAEIVIKDFLVSSINISRGIYSNSLNEIYNEHQLIYGTVKAVNKDSIAISYYTNEDDIIQKEKIQILPFNENYKVIEEGIIINFKNIEVGQLATIKVLNNFVQEVYLEPKKSILTGTLIKKLDHGRFIILKTLSGKIFKLKVNDDIKILKNLNEETNINNLSIGDKLTVNILYDTCLNIDAKSEAYEKRGIVTEIKITLDCAILYLKSLDEQETIEKFYVNQNFVDIYSVKISDLVSVTGESEEIYKLDLITRNYNKPNFIY